MQRAVAAPETRSATHLTPPASATRKRLPDIGIWHGRPFALTADPPVFCRGRQRSLGPPVTREEIAKKSRARAGLAGGMSQVGRRRRSKRDACRTSELPHTRQLRAPPAPRADGTRSGTRAIRKAEVPVEHRTVDVLEHVVDGSEPLVEHSDLSAAPAPFLRDRGQRDPLRS